MPWATTTFDKLPELARAVGAGSARHRLAVVAGVEPCLLTQVSRPSVRFAGRSDPRLQSMVVPLGVDGRATSWPGDTWRDKVNCRRRSWCGRRSSWPRVDYGFPQPSAAGPGAFPGRRDRRRFGGEGLCLLQIGVQAGHVAPRPHPPVHLVLAVDTSANMRWGGRMDMVRRALKELTGGSDAGDRLSLVAFGEDARVVIEDVGPGEADQFVAAVGSLSAKGSSNVAEGLGRAYDVARQQSAAGRPAVRVVLLTDGMVDLTADSASRILQQVTEAAGRGTPLHVVDLSQQSRAIPSCASLPRRHTARSIAPPTPTKSVGHSSK